MEHGIKEVARHPEVESGYEKEENTFENQPSGSREKVIKGLTEFLAEICKSEEPLHLRIVTNSLKAGPFSEKKFLGQLMDFVTRGRHRLSVIVFNTPRPEDEINLFEILQMFLRHPEYGQLVSLYELKKNEKKSFIEAFRHQLDPYIENYDPLRGPLSLFTDRQMACCLTRTGSEWQLESILENNTSRITGLQDWIDRMMNVEGVVPEYQFNEKEKEHVKVKFHSSSPNFLTKLPDPV